MTTKSLTSEPRKGHPGPVVAEFEGGFLNSMGLCNPGIDAGLEEVRRYKESGAEAAVMISLFADSAEGFADLARKAAQAPADFLELNLSCPNVRDEYGAPLAASPGTVAAILRAVKAVTDTPLIAKLSPNVTDLDSVARGARDGGADALCLINTLGPGLLIDIEAIRPVLYNRTGGLSGPCVKPIALRLVHAAARSAGLPLIGTGGITTGNDALEMWMAGASLIGVGTAIYYRGEEVFTHILDEMTAYLERKGYKTLEEVPRMAPAAGEKGEDE